MVGILINARRQKIVEILRKTNSMTPITAATLARIIGVSERAIRYDLLNVADELKAGGFKLCRKSQKGMWVEVLQEADTQQNTSVKEYIMSRDERCWAVIVMILGSNEPVSSDWIAEQLVVSRSTLLTDLKMVRQMLDEYQLVLQGKRGAGINIVGDEKSVRQLLLKIFSRYHYDFAALSDKRYDKRYEYDLLNYYAADIPIGRLYIIFMEFVARKCTTHSDFSLTCMMLSLLIQLKRSQLGFHLAAESVEKFPLEDNQQLQANARYLFEHLVAAELIENDNTELLFCMMQLLSSKLTFADWPDDTNQSGTARLMEGFSLARSFVEYCQVWLSEILVDDEELMYNLALHLQPAIKRAQYGIELTNPLLPKIRQEYDDLFMISLKAAEKIEQQLKIKISDDEIGYLTIHLGAALERRKSMLNRKLNVVLVCGNGIGTSNLLARTLSNRVEYLNIIKVAAVRELDKTLLEGCDIIISTLPLNLKNEAVLHISPILSQDEITVIEQQLQYCYRRKFPVRGSREQELASAISLSDILDSNMILLNAAAADWEEAIRLAGEGLIQSGSVEAGYVDAMVDCVREMGPYIVIGNGLAMPHAGCGTSVNKVGLSVVILDKPVNFGSPLHDPVDLVFAFATIDEKAHLHLLEELWGLFNDARALTSLRNCRDKQAVLKLLGTFAK